MADARVASGIRARLVALARPRVEAGHVGAWIGVGGPGLGAGGKDAWIQIGLSAFSDGISHLYIEVDQPSTGPRYRQLVSHVPIAKHYDVAVREIPLHPGWWRAWLNGAPASPPIHLAGSDGRWRPIATGETWDGGTRVCNEFAYRFERVAVATAPGAHWVPLLTGERFQNRGYLVSRRAGNDFVVSSTPSERTRASASN